MHCLSFLHEANLAQVGDKKSPRLQTALPRVPFPAESVVHPIKEPVPLVGHNRPQFLLPSSILVRDLHHPTHLTSYSRFKSSLLQNIPKILTANVGRVSSAEGVSRSATHSRC